tara:strand:- start:2295 stop:3059 length:765 start_codon:yes stop_codon:yes gene_type:complete
MFAPARSRYCLIPVPLTVPRLRLVCFAHAGAGASTYHPWAAPLAASGIEVRSVQYPGRESRWGEPLLVSVDTMAEQALARWSELAGDDDVPVVVYGHSMGVLIAYEMARRLSPGMKPVRHLVLGGRNPPHIPSLYPPIHHLPDDVFIRKVAERYQNLPAEILADPDMLALIIPVLKADFEMVDTYRITTPESPPLEIPLTIVQGTDDPFTQSERLSDWARYTHATCGVRRLAGGHFFHLKAVAPMVSLIREISG